MQTKKDLYQAHKLMTQRVTFALLQGKPGAAESPLRRTGVGALCGVMVVVLVAAGFGITGLLLKGGARNLEQPGLVLIEKETGAAYSYSADQKRLIPFLNYTSARLAMSGNTIQRKLVSSRSLAKYTRGSLTGIPNAPESLPDPSKLVRAPWSLCVRTPPSSTIATPTVSLIGGRDVAGRPLVNTQAVLVQGGSQAWLIWRNTRMRISRQSVRTLTNAQPPQVDERWLNGLPQGPDYAAPLIPNRGARAEPTPDGRIPTIGQVYRVPPIAGSAARWYVQLFDGLSGISETQAVLLLFTVGASSAIDITPAAATNISNTTLFNRQLPESPPKALPYEPSEPLCAVYSDRSLDARFTIGGTLPPPPATRSTIDQIVLPGGATFAGTLTAPNQQPQSFSLITEQGVRYPIPTPEDATKLGYSAASSAQVPANILQLFRPGPALTSSAAVRPVPAT
ncbi:type VII secretion protein EccB [Spirillospora sp. NPDC048911]|uniref:type VII secretion protein EccB n=1 Tax=Spirillospora sp. NPDC048911 TaxID=3364527 RepID=UPI0037230468